MLQVGVGLALGVMILFAAHLLLPARWLKWASVGSEWGLLDAVGMHPVLSTLPSPFLQLEICAMDPWKVVRLLILAGWQVWNKLATTQPPSAHPPQPSTLNPSTTLQLCQYRPSTPSFSLPTPSALRRRGHKRRRWRGGWRGRGGSALPSTLRRRGVCGCGWPPAARNSLFRVWGPRVHYTLRRTSQGIYGFPSADAGEAFLALSLSFSAKRFGEPGSFPLQN